MKYLVTYGSRKGATKKSAYILSTELQQVYGHDIRIMDSKNVQNEDIMWADHIIIGSSIIMGKWKKSSLKLLKKVNSKRFSIFVSAAVSLSEETPVEKLEKGANEENFDRVEFAVKKFINPVCEKFKVKPYSKIAFGGRLTVLGHEVINNINENSIKEWVKTIS